MIFFFHFFYYFKFGQHQIESKEHNFSKHKYYTVLMAVDFTICLLDYIVIDSLTHYKVFLFIFQVWSEKGILVYVIVRIFILVGTCICLGFF